MKLIRQFFTVLFMLFYTLIGYSQVNTQDSLVLVDLYNALKGSGWHHSEQWLTGRVREWYGITVIGNRVVEINVPYNNLAGDLPSAITMLDAVQKIDFANNNITSLPSLTSMSNLMLFRISGNRLTFQDIEPNLGLGNPSAYFIYSSQDYVDMPKKECVEQGTDFTLVIPIDLDPLIHNQYQWRKDGKDIVGATNRQYTIHNAKPEDEGDYSCRIINSVVTDLTLYTNFTQVVVFDMIGADAGNDEPVCSDRYTLRANTPPANAQGFWAAYQSSGSIANFNSPVTQVTKLNEGINIFVWSISNDCYVSTDQVIITRNLPPTVAKAGSDANTCGSYTLKANEPFAGTGKWMSDSPLVVFDNLNSPTATVSNLQQGINKLTWTIENLPCPASIDEIILSNSLPPTSANAGLDKTVCGTVNLNADFPVIGKGLWRAISGDVTIQNISLFNSAITFEKLGDHTLEWTTSNGICLPSSDQVTFTNIAPVTKPKLVDSLLICTDKVQLQTLEPVVGSISWISDDINAFFDDPTSVSSQLQNISNGYTQVILSVDNACNTPKTDTLIIHRYDVPPPAFAGNDTSVCQTVQLNANRAVIGFGRWSVIEGMASFSSVTQYNAIITNLSAGKNRLQWSISGSVCPTSADEIVITNFSPLTKPVLADDIEVCTLNFNLTATLPANSIGYWSVLSGESVLSSSTLAQTIASNLSAGENKFSWTIDNLCNSPVSDEIIVFRYQQPLLASAGADAEVCGNYQLNAEVPTIGSGKWNVQSGFASISDVTLANSNLAIHYIGNNVLSWTVSNGVCPTVSDFVTLTNITPLAKPELGNNLTLCVDTVTLTTSSPLTGFGSWSVAKGNAIIDNPTNLRITLKQLSLGENVIRWTVDNVCNKPVVDTIIVFRDALPTKANAGKDAEACENFTLSATNPAIGTGSWALIEGKLLMDNPAKADAQLYNIATGNNKLVWTVKNGVCPASNDTMVVFGVEPLAKPVLADDFAVCNTSAVLSATSPLTGSGIWINIAGIAIIENSATNITPVSALQVGGNTFRWTIDNACKLPVYEEITIKREAEPTQADAGLDLEACDQATLNANLPIIGTGKWSFTAGNAVFVNATLNQTTVTNLMTGKNILTWTISNGVCEPSVDFVNVTRYLHPTIASAGSDTEACGTVQLTANEPEIGSGEWTLGFGDANIESPSATTTRITLNTIGEHQFIWTIQNGNCEASSDTLIIKNISPLEAPVLPEGFHLCTNIATFEFQPTLASVSNWSVVAGDATLEVNLPNSIKANNLSYHDNVFRYTVDNICKKPASSEITITRDREPTMAYAGNDREICSDTVYLHAQKPVNGYGTWSVFEGGAVVADKSAAYGLSQNISTGSNRFVWQVSNGTCAPTFDTVTIIRVLPLLAPILPDDNQICNSNHILTAPDIINATGKWTVQQGNANLLVDDNPVVLITDLSIGLNVFRWTIDNVCKLPVFDSIAVFRYAMPSVADAGKDAVACENYILAGNTPAIGMGTWSIIKGSAQFSNLNAPNSSISNIGEGENIFRWTIENGVCSPQSADVKLTGFKPLQPPVLPNDLQQCDFFANLSATLPSGANGKWTVIKGNGSIALISSVTAKITNMSLGENTVRWTINNLCQKSAYDEMTITVFGYPLAYAGEDTTSSFSPQNPFKLRNYTSGYRSENYSYSWSPFDYLSDANAKTPDFVPITTGTYKLTLIATNELDCAVADEVSITLTYDGDVIVPTLFTPNSDGANDQFVIFGLWAFPDNELLVFNRWGNLVYQKVNYNNDWDGHPNVANANQDEVLPDETYYYVLNLGGDKSPVKGYFLIRK